MKKKYLNLLIIFVLTLTIGVRNVLAEGWTGNANTSGQGSTNTGNAAGTWNDSIEGIRITLVDSNGDRISGTKSKDYISDKSSVKSRYGKYNWNTKRSRREVLSDSDNIKWEIGTINFDTLDFKLYMGTNAQNVSGTYFKDYFLAMARDNNDKLISILDSLVINGSWNDLITNKSICKSVKDGYFIIEPLTDITTKSGTYIGTGSELVWQAVQDNATNLFGGAFSNYNIPFSIYLTENFAGYQAVSLISSLDRGIFLNQYNRGYALGAFHITDVASVKCTTTCYKVDYSCDSTTCTNTDDNNKRYCSTQVSSYECPFEEVDNTYHQSGKKTIELIDGVCSLYCTEQATVSYPGNVGSAVLLGTNLEWPTKINGKYPLVTKSTLTCKVEMNDKSSVSQECLDVAASKSYQYLNNSGAKLTYTAPVSSGKSLATSTSDISLKNNCDYSIYVNGDSVKIYDTCSYSLPTNKNVGVDKRTLNFINVLKESASTAASNYIIMKNGGVIPIDGFSWSDSKIFSNALFDSKYGLQISDMPLGYAGQFTSTLNKNAYVCNYQITTDLNGGESCVCPPGTKNAGMKLSSLLENSPKTCAEAQNIYCDESLPYCPDDSETPGKDISNCMLTHDYDYCVEKNCHSGPGPQPIYCKMPDGSYTDITDCWNENGQDENAKKVCSANVGCINNYCPSTSVLGDSYNYRDDPDYASCLSGGGEADYCMNLVCNPECIGDNCDYVCEKYTELTGIVTDYPNKSIAACVSYERGSGKNLVEAITACGKKECFKGAEGKIIYRTISLENPFPSKDADSTVTQNLSVGMFNDTIKGRYPGANWNGEQLVKNKILNNRGYDGSAIYNEATPLYTINLDAKAIKAIRSYNKRQVDGYADFTLKCTDGAYCISSFLRSGITRADGTNMLDSGSSTCAGASNKITFNSCYKKR